MNQQEGFSTLDKQAYASPAYQRQNSGRWLFALKTFEHLLPKQGKLIRMTNNVMRIADDIADGDLPPPNGYARVDYLERIRGFIQIPNQPKDNFENYLSECLNLANSLGIDIRRELDLFFEHFLFDAKRLGTGQIFPQAQLDASFNTCARATIGGMLKVFGQSENNVENFLPLGRAFLGYQTLRDFDQDVARGLINIPLEAFYKHGIDPQAPFDRYSPGVRRWFNDQAVSGFNLLEQHQQIVRNIELPFLLTKGVLPLIYERPSRKYFKEVLAGIK